MKVTEKLSSIENEHSIIDIRLFINKRVWNWIMKEWKYIFDYSKVYDRWICSRTFYKQNEKYKDQFAFSDIPINMDELIRTQCCNLASWNNPYQCGFYQICNWCIKSFVLLYIILLLA